MRGRGHGLGGELHAAASAALPFLSLRCKVYLINSLINVSAPVPLHVPPARSPALVRVRVPMRVPMRMFPYMPVCVRGV